ncbi:cupin domain-containing protein [Aquimarina sp. SS2-1]|uniref:cupin domain-containing protein n=1 Tax=Aquimarina besae TaxID=3342247 RepID=UPI0036720705
MNYLVMKKASSILALLFPIIIFSQSSQYHITSYLDEGTKAPNTHYIGEAWLSSLFKDDEDLKYNITKATFRANSTLDWHKHSSPQVLIILDGQGYYQERGKKPIVIKAGDIVKCKKNIEHWHSSTKDNDVTYLALYAGDKPTRWTEVLTQEYYDNIAEELKRK